MLMVAETDPIKGVTFRPFQGEADYAVIARIFTASNAADRIEETRTADEIANEFAHLDLDADPRHDYIFAEVEGQTVAYSKVDGRLNNRGERIYWQWGYVLPQWRRKRVGQAMLMYTEARAREHAQDHPFNGPNILYGVGEGTALGKIALWERNNYSPARYFFSMRRKALDDLPEATLPPGFELRPATPDHLRAIWNAREDCFRESWAYATKTESDYAAWVNEPSQDRGLWQIVLDRATNEIAGVSLNSIFEEDNRIFGFKRGWINSLGVRPRYRRCGLARAMLAAGLRVLRERGMTEAALGVDTENSAGAPTLYESVGFKAIKSDTVYQKPLSS
jgi:ribosomal protein S18 acetylase RimI-like enzyme